MTDDKLKLRYIPLSHAKRWDQNPKRHDLEGLVRSIQAHGFGDPPKFDATLGGLVYGNGRTEALERLAAQGGPPPRGILQRKDGEWAVPVIFGVDAASEAAAVAFAIDHNNLTLLGGDLDLTDLLTIWDEDGLRSVLEEAPDAADLLASLDVADVEELLKAPDFEPVPDEEQSRLDQRRSLTCPECGHTFQR